MFPAGLMLRGPAVSTSTWKGAQWISRSVAIRERRLQADTEPAGRLCVHSLSAQESEAHSHELVEFDWGTVVDEQQNMVAALLDIPRRT